VGKWIERHKARIEQFRLMVNAARSSGAATAPMLAQIANQARILLGR
jgi:glutamate dehydrogenase